MSDETVEKPRIMAVLPEQVKGVDMFTNYHFDADNTEIYPYRILDWKMVLVRQSLITMK